MADDMFEFEKVLTLPIWVKMVVVTGQPSNLILLEETDNNFKLPICMPCSAYGCEDAAEIYVKWNFGFCEPWCNVNLVGINDSIDADEYRKMFVYYGVTIGEQNKVEKGEWKPLMEAMQKLPPHDVEMVQKGILQWAY